MITLEAKGIERLKASLGEKAKRLPNEIAIAINATAKRVRREMAKEVTQELAIAQKNVSQTLSQPRKASAGLLGATIRLSKTKRLSLKDFGAKQNKTGVSYRISKSKGRQTIAGAFQGPKPGAMKASWGGNVFKRVGKARLPIVKLQGPSPWGVFVGRKATPRIVEMANEELKKQIERRIRFNVLKQQGAI